MGIPDENNHLHREETYMDANITHIAARFYISLNLLTKNVEKVHDTFNEISAIYS